MTPERAAKIVSEYGQVMERAFASSIVAPISMLPLPVELIKEALTSYAAALHRDGQLRGDIKDHLAVGYMHLADFIDDAEASRARAALQRMINYDLALSGHAQFDADLEEFKRIERRVAESRRALAIEYREFEVRIGARHEVGDFDADVAAVDVRLVAVPADQRTTSDDAIGTQKTPWWKFWRRR